jgi:hypothetical protein
VEDALVSVTVSYPSVRKMERLVLFKEPPHHVWLDQQEPDDESVTIQGTDRFPQRDYEDMKARTMAVARGEQRVTPYEPKVWFTSTESFAKVLSADNRDLLRVIVEQAPCSLD